MTIRMLAGCFLLAIAVASCSKPEPKLDDEIAKHRAAVEPKLAAAEAIGKAAPPTLAKDGCDLAGGPPPRILVTSGPNKGQGNALIVYVEDLADVTAQGGSPAHRVPSTGLLNDCAALVRKKQLAAPSSLTAKGAHAQVYLPLCAAAQYLYVIVTKSKTDPVVSGDSYSPGSMSGEVHLFRLEGSKHLGGFAFNAATPTEVTTYEGPSRSAQSDVDGKFMTAIALAIDGGIKKNVPGAIVD
jgi:hypothetical protein